MTRRQRILVRIALVTAGVLVLGAAAAGYRRADLMLLYENIVLFCTT